MIRNNYRPVSTTPSSFEIETIEDRTRKASSGNLSFSERHAQFRIVWIVTNDQTCIHCLHSPQRFDFEINHDMRGYIISFTNEFLSSSDFDFDPACRSAVTHLFSSAAAISLDNRSIQQAYDLLMSMLDEYSNLNKYKTEILRPYLKILLIHISRNIGQTFNVLQKTRNIEIVKLFVEELNENFREKKMVADYARMLCVTPNYLNAVVKKMTGSSASQHIRLKIVNEAKRLAIANGNSMKEIAYSLGFGDAAHFSKFFKQTSGNNFSEFKKKRVGIAVVDEH